MKVYSVANELRFTQYTLRKTNKKIPSLSRDGMISRGATLVGRPIATHSALAARCTIWRSASRVTLGLRLELLGVSRVSVFPCHVSGLPDTVAPDTLFPRAAREGTSPWFHRVGVSVGAPHLPVSFRRATFLRRCLLGRSFGC